MFFSATKKENFQPCLSFSSSLCSLWLILMGIVVIIARSNYIPHLPHTEEELQTGTIQKMIIITSTSSTSVIFSIYSFVTFVKCPVFQDLTFLFQIMPLLYLFSQIMPPLFLFSQIKSPLYLFSRISWFWRRSFSLCFVSPVFLTRLKRW